MKKEVKEFLELECRAGEYGAFTIMVNKMHLERFIDYLNKFSAQGLIVENGREDDGGTLLFGNKIGLVEDNDES